MSGDVTALREALAEALHAGCGYEHGGYDGPCGHLAEALLPVVLADREEHVRRAQDAALRPIRDFHTRWGDTDGDTLDPLTLWEDLGRLLAGEQP